MQGDGKKRSNLRTVVLLSSVVAGMVGMSFAAVPLYDLFCRVTGYGGTPSTAEVYPEEASERTMTIRFNSDTNPNLPWDFKPAQRAVEVQVGEPGEAIYTARNLADSANVGTATYNVTPDKAGVYFSKVQCFCFTEQHLASGQSVEMPVQFFVDPAIMDDPNLNDVNTITLSYTFFPKPGVEPDPQADADGAATTAALQETE